MARVAKPGETNGRRRAPALTPEDRENQMIGYAVDLAERKLLDGTASSQMIILYLQMGSVRQKLERDNLIEENRLLRAKADAIQSEKKVEKAYKEALDAMRLYSGRSNGDDQDEYEEDPDL